MNKTYNFTFIFSQLATDFESAADLFYQSGCDDALFSYMNGMYQLDFDRNASSLKEALDSALQDIMNVNIEIRIKAIIFNNLEMKDEICHVCGKCENKNSKVTI